VRARGQVRQAKRYGEMNPAEQRYSQSLEIRRVAGEILLWRFEAVKLRLAQGAWYTCDFWCLDVDGYVEMHEFKGHWREAARLRIKVAAQEFPELRFLGVVEQYQGRTPLGVYTYEEISP
jgi:hypothetical protein